MNRKDATHLVLAEAFAETGLGMLAELGEDPGFERIEALKLALGFLVDDLANDDVLDRQLVSALFVLGNRVPELLRSRDPNGPSYRETLANQADELVIYVTDLIEGWNNWPDWESHPLRTHSFETERDAG